MFQIKVDALKKGETRYKNDVDEDNHLLSPTYVYNTIQSNKHDTNSDEHDVRLPKIRFNLGLFKPNHNGDS